MRLNYGLDGSDAATAAMARAARDAPRAAGKVFGDVADDVAADVEGQWGSLGWGATSEVRARRGSGGARDPRAFVFVSGGAAWQEDHPTSPRPTLGPAWDRHRAGVVERVADAVGGLW